MTEPHDEDEFEDLDDLFVDSPPELIDEAIERVRARLDDGAPVTRLRLANLCWLRYLQSTAMPTRQPEPGDVDTAVETWAEILPMLKDDPAVDREALAWQYLNYAEAMRVRTNTDDGAGAAVEATRLVGPDSSAWYEAMYWLSAHHVERFERSGGDGDFIAAEQTLRALLDVPVEVQPERGATWIQLSRLYEIRFMAHADPADRDRSFEALRAGWTERPDPLITVFYASAFISPDRPATLTEVTAAVDMLAVVDPDDLPDHLRSAYHNATMRAHFRRYVDGRVDPTDLLTAVAEASRFIDDPGLGSELVAEARVIRATADLDHALATQDRMAKVDSVIGDLEAARDEVNPGLRAVVDVQLAKALAERARQTADTAHIDRAVAFAEEALLGLADATAFRAEVSYHLGCMLVTQVEAGRGAAGSTQRAIDLLTWIAGEPAAHPSVRTVAAIQLATVTTAQWFFVGGGGPKLDTSISWLEAALESMPLDDMNRVAAAAGLAGALMMRYELRGDLADLQWCLDLLTDIRDEAREDSHHHELALALAQVQIAWAVATGEGPEANALQALDDALRAMRPQDGKRPQVLRSLAGGYAIRASRTRRADDWQAATRYAAESVSTTKPEAPFAAQVLATAAGVMSLAGQALNDLNLLRDAVDLFDTIADDPARHRLRALNLSSHGMALLHLYRADPQPSHLEHAVGILTKANDLTSQEPGAHGAGEIGMAIAEAVAMTGEWHRAADLGRKALQAYARQVLLQSGTAEAMTAARQSATDALKVARYCLRIDDNVGACLALETGRGLVLHSATVAATVPQLLRDADQPDLADSLTTATPSARDGGQWRLAVPTIPSDLRFQVLNALERRSSLLDPPSHEALCEALRSVDADCLVYLFPGAADESGLALIIEADGETSSLDLPNLTGDWSVPEKVQVAISRDIDAPSAGTAIGRDLTESCGAAWDAAIRQLLDHWRLTHEGEPHKEPHIVLVVDGALATVPWHAAYSRDGSDRWAIDEAAFSYIASGRLLVDVARREPTAPTRSGLVIGNPDTDRPEDDLEAAGIEATTIFTAHYSDGRFCGRPSDSTITPTSPGTAADVLGWLTDASAAPVMHLACHGSVRGDGPATSYLLLAGGATVSAEEILRTASTRSAGRPSGLVSLAACTTHRAGRAYDEAVTLSTALLVAGAATTIGSLWRVPDHQTAQLMVSFHDNLAAKCMPAHEALRQAQRTMRSSGGATLADWAGFVHLGR